MVGNWRFGNDSRDQGSVLARAAERAARPQGREERARRRRPADGARAHAQLKARVDRSGPAARRTPPRGRRGRACARRRASCPPPVLRTRPRPATMSSGGWWGQRRNRQLALIACFLLPSLAIFFLYRILPLGWNVILSFQSWSPLKPAVWVGFEHYDEMLVVRRRLLGGALEHADLHRRLAARDRRGAGRGAAGELRSQGRVGLPHHRLPVLPADDRRRRDHLALDVRRARRDHQLRAARERARRPAGRLPAEFRLGAAVGDLRRTSGR